MPPKLLVPVITISLLILAACGAEREVTETSPGVPNPEPADTMPFDPDLPVILAYGDSLTAGHNVARDRSYPSQLQSRLDALGYAYQVVNHGNSGDTTAGGIARLDGALGVEPEIVILAFGGNDGLQGRPIDSMRSNLSTMIKAFQGIDTQIVLAGITLPRNYGPDYIVDFENVFVELADTHDVALIPFFLEGLVDLEALDSADATLAESVRYMQPNGTHPTGEGYTIVAETVLEAITPYLNK